ncbi:type VI secretion system Vgr family protein [Paraburkholderia bryophila]|uniref:Type VI secretion system secreted protein VgrG n=1 Tax=Paraburkholderia bryophila TaxID=420952 RepID=A0A7Y9WH75_9BURK|nr:type VI secretion system Vgr family protein [Paraburkholderia bryophila]NYH20786.1 type VI secretion system secreted protein VgrG [Paraburkholderia bryophila]
MNAQDIIRAVQGGLIQQDRLLKLDTSLGANVLLPQRLAGWSRIGRHFEFTIDVLSTSGDIKLKKLIGQQVTLWIEQADKSYLPHHGYVFAVRRLGAEGGLTSYQIRFASWMNFLKFRRDQRIWQDKPADEILTDVFNAHSQAKGYFSFALWKPLPPRSYCTQYEDDWTFVHRLMEAEGLFGVWTHAADGKSHKLTITDRLDTCEPLTPQTVQFSRYGTNSEVDALVHWSSVRTLHSAVLTGRTFDYKNPSPLANPKSVSVPTLSHELPEELEFYEYTGPYAYFEQARGEHLTKIRMEEWESRAKRFYGAGGLRGVDAGRWFELANHPEHDKDSADRRQFAVIETIWLIENNIPGSSHHANFPHSLQGQLAEAMAGGEDKGPASVPHPDGSTGFYFVEIEAQRRSVPFRSPFEHEAPLMQMQTATVVGPQGQPVYTDELGRVKVQFHWDRIGQRNERSSCWVRVSQPWAGQGSGMIHVPRIGDEVVVSFLNGSPDRPVITGRVPNGINFVQWKLPDNQALSGMRSRDLAGAGATHVVADDTPGKLQVQVSSDHEQSRLVVGYNTRIDGHAGRGQARGIGWELATDSWGVLRANRGMLITTETRSGASAAAKDMGETAQRFAQARDQHNTLANAAVQAQAQDGQDQPAVAIALQKQNDEIKGQGAGDFPELSKPHLVFASPAGIEATSAGSTHLASGEHMAVTTGGHVSMSSGNSLLASARNAIRFFAYKLGIRMVSYAGDIDLKALQKNLNLLAKLEITQTANRITIKATEEVMLHGGDSYISLKSGKITVGGSVYEVNAQSSNLPPKPMGVSPNGAPAVQANDQTFRMLTPSGRSLPGVPYRMTADSGAHVFQTNPIGRSATVNTEQEEGVKFAPHWDELFTDADK